MQKYSAENIFMIQKYAFLHPIISFYSSGQNFWSKYSQGKIIIWGSDNITLFKVASYFNNQHKLCRAFYCDFFLKNICTLYTLSCGNVTCSRPQQTTSRTGIKPGTPRPKVRCATHCASPLHKVTCVLSLKDNENWFMNTIIKCIN